MIDIENKKSEEETMKYFKEIKVAFDLAAAGAEFAILACGECGVLFVMRPKLEERLVQGIEAPSAWVVECPVCHHSEEIEP